jgi:hypothetical protein
MNDQERDKRIEELERKVSRLEALANWLRRKVNELLEWVAKKRGGDDGKPE